MTRHPVLPHPFIPLTSFLAYATGDERPKRRPDWAHIGEEKMARCPRCNSPQPHLHPAVQVEGEVSICTHGYHLTPTNQNRQPERDRVLRRRAEKAAS